MRANDWDFLGWMRRQEIALEVFWLIEKIGEADGGTPNVRMGMEKDITSTIAICFIITIIIIIILIVVIVIIIIIIMIMTWRWQPLARKIPGNISP